jgi:acyl carrier protein
MLHSTLADGLSDDQLLVQLKTLMWTAIDEDYREAADIARVTPQTALATLPLDSLAVVELNYGIEEAFGLYISEEEAAAFRTVGDIIRHIQTKRGPSKPYP